MSAAQLRKAAETLRDRAGSATDGPWNCATTGVESGDHWYVLDLPTMHAVCWIRADDGDNEAQRPKDAAYIATMDPAVGLALADVLDLLASRGEAGLAIDLPALDLARAINGGAS